MPIVQPAIPRAASVLGDNIGIFSSAALLINLIPVTSVDAADWDRSMQRKHNVSFWHNLTGEFGQGVR
jgi:hypothetical protein